MRRKIIRIDEEKCNGCGLCIPGCPEGALRIVEGKARLVEDVYCDGLGACLGNCPEGAITIEEREAAAFDEALVMENVIRQGREAVDAHLAHLREHNETAHLRTALDVLRRKGSQAQPAAHFPIHPSVPSPAGGCPGSRSSVLRPAPAEGVESGCRPSQLTHWPIQLHLIHPLAPHFSGSHLLLAADCVAFAAGDFHRDYLKGKTLAIACPKLDNGQESYLQKLTMLVEQAGVCSITVMIMQVPCCSGLLQLARHAVSRAARQVPIEAMVVSLQGEVLQRISIPAA